MFSHFEAEKWGKVGEEQGENGVRGAGGRKEIRDDEEKRVVNSGGRE